MTYYLHNIYKDTHTKSFHIILRYVLERFVIKPDAHSRSQSSRCKLRKASLHFPE